MPRAIRNSKIDTRTARLKLNQRSKPYWFGIARGIALGYRRNTRLSGTWSVRCSDGTGGNRSKRFAIADDQENSDGKKVLTYFEAVRVAFDIGRLAPDSLVIDAGVSLEQRVAAKAARFVDDEIAPACYLYRHYDHAGDLLYVGISLSPIRRQEDHSKDAMWRHMILRILIEPFTSREEALRAETRAIREEFPKFNGRHNRRRHPALELHHIEREEARQESL